MSRRQELLEAQRRRTRELDIIRISRRLTLEEQAESDRLAHAAHMRAWRAAYAEKYGHPYHAAVAS